MTILGRVSVFPTLPEPISRLEELAYNLWWSWTPEAQSLWQVIDPALWERIYHNPVRFLREVAQEKLDAAAQSESYLESYRLVMDAFDAYMNDGNCWYDRAYDGEEMQIAYFSAEFGLHESLPIYSGGLGILSGDHCKAASDLGLPFVGVGFLYPQGYFQQRIDREGKQGAVYHKLDLNEVPARPALDPSGEPLMVQVELPGRTVSAQIWRIQVGRIELLMLDTDVDPNAPEDRALAARLYGGDEEMRVSQEIILGIGGVRALEMLGYAPTVFHMNEGHSAFLGLERVRQLVERGLAFAEAVEVVRASTIFTTHTPVPAGNDAFPFELVERYFYNYWPRLGIGRDAFLELGRHDMEWGPRFSMTVLALRLSGRANGVSELHGRVSRGMWRELWPGTPLDEVPISHVTNGVHHPTWIGEEIEALFDRHLIAGWRERRDEAEVWEPVYRIPDDEFWATRRAMKQSLVAFVRDRLASHYHRLGLGPAAVRTAERALDPDALTIGFARRFATYKRATLIFRDIERLRRILGDADRPVQLIFSGKAHPKDEPGKALIQRIFQQSLHDPALAGRVVFLEDYDMNVARHMLKGVDVWLNNPRRPLEASGTSGEKAAMNGAPNFSVLDGWWREGYNGKNGWAIGEERSYSDPEVQDEEDALSLYATLEDEIIPLYYAEQHTGWLEVVRESIATITPQFNMLRMVKDYTNQLYVPAQRSGRAARAEEFAHARKLAAWKQRLTRGWEQVAVEAEQSGTVRTQVGRSLPLQATVRLGELHPDDVRVEIVTGVEHEGEIAVPRVTPMRLVEPLGNGSYRYEGAFTPDGSGQRAYGIRILPATDGLIHPHELARVRWA